MIKTKTKRDSIVYCAKDVFTALNLPYKGISSIEAAGATAVKCAFPTKVGTATAQITQYALSPTMVKRIAKHNGRNTDKIFGTNPDKEVSKLNQTVQKMKAVLAQLLTKENKARKLLPVSGVSVKVTKADPLQAQARRMIRDIVQEYASNRANELSIIGDGRSIFFDLSFKALYDAYKEQTKTKIDLKAIADKETKDTGNKVSGLQIAERLGLAVELLAFTKSFYANKK